ncbi:MAG: NTP transferase domain-containing protein [Lachnospiraceae bacterium]|nr:NTP transferase domain-containing protein [Lachnospiraceae bacterium]
MLTSDTYPDASAVVSFFRMTEKKHLFLTGERGSGKSYLFHAIIKELASASDFSSYHHLLSRKTEDGQVVIQSDLIENDSEYVIGRLCKESDTTKSSSNKMCIAEDGFVHCAVPAIEAYLAGLTDNSIASSDAFFAIDELGYLESSCLPFQTAVRRLLASSRTVAVLRKQSTPFLDELKNRDDALVIDIDAPFQALACIIMASGMSKRFGSNKLLADCGGNTLFENAVKISRYAGFGTTLTVTRHEEIANLCKKSNIEFLLHDLPNRNDTVRLGITQLLKKGSPDGILFLPADQPLLSRTSLQLLCLSFLHYKDKICRLSYNGTGAAPIIFPHKFYKELLTLPEKKGGGFLAKKYPEQVKLIPARDEFELSDADTPEELTLLLHHLH